MRSGSSPTHSDTAAESRSVWKRVKCGVDWDFPSESDILPNAVLNA